MYKVYRNLTRLDLVFWLLIISNAAMISYNYLSEHFGSEELIWFCCGFFFLFSGAFALEQVQSYKWDIEKGRTHGRPIAQGKIKPAAGAILAVTFIAVGSDFLFRISGWFGFFGILSVLFVVLFLNLGKKKLRSKNEQ